jgi:hypothetical protein
MSDTSDTSGISVKLDLLHDDVRDMKSVLKDLTKAINRLAIVEERQSQIGESLGRAFKSIEDVKERTTALELQAITTAQTNTWVSKAVWAAAAAAAMYIGKSVGLV